MPNRLAGEASPYLLQHAHNPVDWYPWGPEALARARSEDRPILLSIGYSACHWCHVMERESFESASIAKLMNEHFVNVKVDREERPDLDHVYQLVVQLMGRSGGWPLTVFLTPDERPFFAGTYFPPAERHGMPGFPKVLEAVAAAYREQRGSIEARAGEITAAIAQAAGGVSRPSAAATGDEAHDTGVSVSAALVEQAVTKLQSRFDEANGGFGHHPKFPSAAALDVLLRAGDFAHVRKALGAMRAGGIWDHLGGGFHRYSTDPLWLVPHFEKMLYDNAQLLRLYTDAWRALREPVYEQTARDIAAYVAREMTSSDGGFYATQDADSEGHEGKFFVWTPAEVDAVCGDDVQAATVAKLAFDVSEDGNFEGSGSSVLSTPVSMEQVAQALSIELESAEHAMKRARAKMFWARELRPKPLRDEKILASWNGLLAGALAQAGSAFGDEPMIAAAVRALELVERALVITEAPSRARVLRHVKDGQVRGPGFLDDHAFVGDAALDLYEATGDSRWVRLARSLAESILAHFHDAVGEGFFFSPDDGPTTLVRVKDVYDHAVPSGSSIACRLLLRLGALVDAKYAAPAERAVATIAEAAAHNPLAMGVTVSLVDRLVRASVDVVLVGPRDHAATRALAGAAQRAYLRDRVIAWADPDDPATLEVCAVLWKGKQGLSEPAAYVCRGRTCSLPITSAHELEKALA
jgi:uncharacterized protein YyaL (SSP411 family)